MNGNPTNTVWSRMRAPSAAPFTGPADDDVTAALFLHLRTQDITAETFVCSVTDARPWDFSSGPRTSVSNFPHRRVLLYGYANPYPTSEAEKRGYRLPNSLALSSPSPRT